MTSPSSGSAEIQDIVVVGGGTAGWMAAASLAHFLGPAGVRITLVESSEIATVGVGEATIPPIMDFIRVLGLDEDALVRHCNATFKLAIKFEDWREPGHAFYHPFGQTGFPVQGVDFSAWWLSRRLAGRAGRLEDYSLMATAAEAGRFSRPARDRASPLSQITYALHFDAALFAEVLKGYALERGVRRIDAKVSAVDLDGESGFIQGVRLSDGRFVPGDLFIDCSGFRGLLIEEALHAGYEDWRKWLPCDRALAVQTARNGPAAPYTLSVARSAGWQWKIPLQNRTGNGYVYSSAHIDDDAAARELMEALDAEPTTTPRVLRVTGGRRRKFWSRNCVALGLAQGFIEPLESTSIHLVQRGLALLLKLFPDRRFSQAEQDQYNAMLGFEYERVRDFLVLHYQPSRRPGAFWDEARSIPLPDSLAQRIELYLSHGRIIRDEAELFPAQSWLYLFAGQGMLPRAPDPHVRALDPDALDSRLEALRSTTAQTAASMPLHDDFIAGCCASAPAMARQA